MILSYEHLAPLDWPQLKCLLWEQIQTSRSESRTWDDIAARVNEKCVYSEPQGPATYEAAFKTIAHAMPAFFAEGQVAGAGQRAWVEMLYVQAQRIFGRPRFMNLGFASIDDSKSPIDLLEKDEPYRFAIQLYDQLFEHVELRNRRVLEVGCGAGGGLDYMTEYIQPEVVVGLDIVAENFANLRSHDRPPNPAAVVGSAEQLPFHDGAFDVVVSVESSEHYRDIERFMREARRVLRPHGKFLLADLRWNGCFDSDWGITRSARKLLRQLEAAGFTILRADDITRNVLRSIEIQDDAKRNWLEGCGLAGNDWKQFFEIMLCIGSRNYDKMRKGEIRYFSIVGETEELSATN